MTISKYPSSVLNKPYPQPPTPQYTYKEAVATGVIKTYGEAIRSGDILTYAEALV
jgi:hypothetical protein